MTFLQQTARPIFHWLDVIALFLKSDFGQRYQRSSISVFFTMFEPVALISVMFITRWLQTGQLDWNDAVFHTSGIIPFYFFMHISMRMRVADLLAPVPGVTWFDRAFAVVLSEVLGKVVVGALLMMTFAALGAITAYPNNLIGVITPCILLMFCGIGVGLFNSSVGRFAPSWLYIYAIAMRILMLGSGLIVRPEFIPTGARWLTDWNPLFHGITWCRSEYFYDFPTFMLDKRFLLLCAVCFSFFGGLIHANTKFSR